MREKKIIWTLILNTFSTLSLYFSLKPIWVSTGTCHHTSADGNTVDIITPRVELKAAVFLRRGPWEL